MRHILGAKLSVVQKKTLENLQCFLQQQNRYIPEAQLLALLDWISTHVKENTSTTSEALQDSAAPPLPAPLTAASSLPTTADPSLPPPSQYNSPPQLLC